MKYFLTKEEHQKLLTHPLKKWCGTIFSGYSWNCCIIHKRIFWVFPILIVIGLILIIGGYFL